MRQQDIVKFLDRSKIREPDSQVATNQSTAVQISQELTGQTDEKWPELNVGESQIPVEKITGADTRDYTRQLGENELSQRQESVQQMAYQGHAEPPGVAQDQVQEVPQDLHQLWFRLKAISLRQPGRKRKKQRSHTSKSTRRYIQGTEYQTKPTSAPASDGMIENPELKPGNPAKPEKLKLFPPANGQKPGVAGISIKGKKLATSTARGRERRVDTNRQSISGHLNGPRQEKVPPRLNAKKSLPTDTNPTKQRLITQLIAPQETGHPKPNKSPINPSTGSTCPILRSKTTPDSLKRSESWKIVRYLNIQKKPDESRS